MNDDRAREAIMTRQQLVDATITNDRLNTQLEDAMDLLHRLAKEVRLGLQSPLNYLHLPNRNEINDLLAKVSQLEARREQDRS